MSGGRHVALETPPLVSSEVETRAPGASLGTNGNSGYALVAAVASLAVFAAIALAVQAATMLATTDAAAEQAQLQASAAADAGVVMALAGLLSQDVAGGWTIDGRTRTRRFGQARLAIRVEDEAGKVPLLALDAARATRLLEGAGLDGERLRVARDGLLDWIDEDEDKRPFGAEEPFYRAAGVRPPNGAVASVGELRLVRGLDPATVARIAPYVTVTPGSFDPRFADPRALAVMGQGGPAAIDRAREAAGQRTAFALGQPDLTGRPLTIAVEATLPGGAAARRRATVSLTGARARPYRVLAWE